MEVSATGNCVYCNHCQPCPADIDIGLINKYYDLSLAGDKMAANHYEKIKIKADSCVECGHCDTRCPFHVDQSSRMQEIAKHFKTCNH
jgi:predicted aldo/keto reductase-like oxidoreductase